KIADSTPDGTYFYYCNLHSVFMSGEITVKRGVKLESQASINRRGRAEANKLVAPVAAVLAKERAGKGSHPGNLAGSGDATTEFLHVGAVEFTPHTINTKVNEPVTWTFIGDHTISFNVPRYSPLFVVNSKGFLQINKKLY